MAFTVGYIVAIFGGPAASLVPGLRVGKTADVLVFIGGIALMAVAASFGFREEHGENISLKL